jgi:hypothetical protein
MRIEGGFSPNARAQSCIHIDMQSQNPFLMPRQSPALVDRLRATLREIDEGLPTRPDPAVAREFRLFLVRAIDDLEDKHFDTAA